MRAVVISLLASLVVACSSDSASAPGPAGGSGGASGAGASGASAGGGAGAGGASGEAGAGGVQLGGASGAGGGGEEKKTLIYAHNDTTLYQLDPRSPDLSVTRLGDFDCVPSKTSVMTDIAVNDQGELWGVSAHAVWPLTIKPDGVHCGDPIKLQNQDVRFYALTFAPAGVLDPSSEVLVAGNTAGELWSIDKSGNITQRGSFGLVPDDDGNQNKYTNAGKPWELSGDIVFVANKGSPVGFATVRDCPSPPDTQGCSFTNTLIEIDVPKLATETTGSVTKAIRGQVLTRPGCTDGASGKYGNLYGIAAWDDKIYGFSRSGNLIEILTSDGTACRVHAYPDVLFAGAGVTTLAPVVPPLIK